MTEANPLLLGDLGSLVPKLLYYPTIQSCPEVINLTECDMPVNRRTLRIECEAVPLLRTEVNLHHVMDK